MSEQAESVVDADEFEEEVEEDAELRFETMRNKLVKEKLDIMKQNTNLCEENIKLRQEHINAMLVLQSEHQNTISIMKQKHHDEIENMKRMAVEERAVLEEQISTERAVKLALEAENRELREENASLKSARLQPSLESIQTRFSTLDFSKPILPYQSMKSAPPKLDSQYESQLRSTIDIISQQLPHLSPQLVEALAEYELFEPDKKNIKCTNQRDYIKMRADQFMDQFKGQLKVSDASTLAGLSVPNRSSSRFVDDAPRGNMRANAAFAADTRRAEAQSRGMPYGSREV